MPRCSHLRLKTCDMQASKSMKEDTWSMPARTIYRRQLWLLLILSKASF